MKYEDAIELAKKIKKWISFKTRCSYRIDIVGSIRRKQSNIKDIDFLITSNDKNILEKIDIKEDHKIINCGKKKCSIILSKIKIDIFYSPLESYAFALLAYTGPKLYNIRLRHLSKTLGYLLNQYGLFYIESNRKVYGAALLRTETDIQRFLGVTVRYPEER